MKLFQIIKHWWTGRKRVHGEDIAAGRSTLCSMTFEHMHFITPLPCNLHGCYFKDCTADDGFVSPPYGGIVYGCTFHDCPEFMFVVDLKGGE